MPDLSDLHAGFAHPPVEYSPIPFWFLNEVLEEDRLRYQLRQMHAQHVQGAVLHPRPGLVTEYLSEEFWQALGACVDEAKALGMRLWAYDEYPWASGIAGGRVPAANPDFIRRHLELLSTDVQGPQDLEWAAPGGRELVALSAAPVIDGERVDAARLVDLRPCVANRRLRWSVPPGSWRLMGVVQRRGWTVCGDHYGSEAWTDLTNADAVDLFIQLTHEEYKKRLGPDLGQTVWAMFTDEPPSTFPAWGLKVAAAFRARHGYAIEPYLPLLWYDGGPETARVRCDYYDTIAALYEEAFFARCGRWCAEQGLDFSGHLLLEENLILNTRFMADAFRQLRHLHIPGIDWIFPGRIPSSVPKLAQSVAHCYGRSRVMSETFALAGWAADMQWMRWQMQWEYVHGVNLLVPHAFFYSISDTVPIPQAPDNLGYRWHDCPPSMFFRQPYWRHYHHFADLTARTGYLLSQGTHVAQCAVLYPITSVWADYRLADGWLRSLHANVYDLPGTWMTADKLEQGPAAVVTDSCYRAIIEGLREHGRDLDVLDDDTLQRAGVEDGRLAVGEERFPALILPAVHTIRRATLEQAAAFWRQGGTVIALRCLPTASAEAGEGDPAVAALVRELWGDAPQPGRPANPRALYFSGGFGPELAGVLAQVAPNAEIPLWGIDVQQRRLPGLEIYYLTSRLDHAVEVEVTLSGPGNPERWHPETGTVTPIDLYRRAGERVTVPLALGPYDGFFVVLRVGPERPHLTATNLRNARVHVAAGRLSVTGEAAAPGRQWARVAVGGRELELAGECAEEPAELPLDETWAFAVLPFPEEPEWRHDMDRLELMQPAGGYPEALRTGSWTEQGLPFFSGTGRYRQVFHLPEAWAGRRLELDLGEVRIAARVYLNGELIGDRPWAPYRLDLPGARAGDNDLAVEVSNTLANYIAVRHADAPEPQRGWAHFKPEQLRSGLIGPVRLIATPRITLV